MTADEVERSLPLLLRGTGKGLQHLISHLQKIDERREEINCAYCKHLEPERKLVQRDHSGN